MNTLKLHSIKEDSGLWPEFLVSAFRGSLPEAGLPYRSDKEGVQHALRQRAFPAQHRQLLADILLHQNREALSAFPKLKENIDLLRREGTYTITTGHQLSLAGGPLFLWYKLCSVLSQAAFLSRECACTIVPLFWMASEDHDLQELNDFTLFGKKIKFEPSFQGAAGRLPSESIIEWSREFSALHTGHDTDALWHAFMQGHNLAQATRNWVNTAFGDYGLLVLDADDAKLKQLFLPLALRELESGFSGDSVRKRTQELIRSGVAAEKAWPVNPRNLNLFWLNETGRHRMIRHEDGTVSAGEAGTPRSIHEWKDAFSAHPDCISPNVVLRPLYQELILPNLAYVGGPGECAYWLQLTDVFRETGLPYPVLLPRRNFLLLTQKQIDTWLASGFQMTEILLDADQIRRQVGESGLPAFLQKDADAALSRVYENVISEVSAIDPTLLATVSAEQQKSLKGMELIRHKLMKSIRNKEEQRLNRLIKISEAVRPEGKPQERAVHLFQFPSLIRKENMPLLLKCCEEPGIKGLYLIAIEG